MQLPKEWLEVEKTVDAAMAMADGFVRVRDHSGRVLVMPAGCVYTVVLRNVFDELYANMPRGKSYADACIAKVKD